jgi:hypothetical protein
MGFRSTICCQRPPSTLFLFLAAFSLLSLPHIANAYEFDMVFQTKCISEDVNEDSGVTGSYSAFDKNDPNAGVLIDARFEDPNGIVVFEKRGVTTADFNLEYTIEGEYKLCFTTKDYATAQRTRVKMSWRSGASATDWEAVARKENLNAIQTEMRKLEKTVHDIHVELQYIRRKEEEMRDVNEAINSRVVWFNVLLLLFCVGMAVWQLYFLRRFFQRKKLL